LLPGFLGPIVGVPLTCAIIVLLRRYVWAEKIGGLETASK
jgi:predicted PurR-regulated permease PerM